LVIFEAFSRSLGAGSRRPSTIQRTTMDWPTNSEETKLIRHYHFSQQMNNIIIYFALLWKQEQVKLSLGVVLYYLVAFGGKKQSKGGQHCYVIAFVVCKDQECWQHFSRIELSQQANNKQAQASKDLKTKVIALYITTAKKCIIWVLKQSMRLMWRCSVCAIHLKVDNCFFLQVQPIGCVW
jgi:hypothetical protein